MARTGIRASAIIIRDNKILLVHRKKDGREYWVFPGGGIEDYEKPEETVKREVFEETNLKVKSVKIAFGDINPMDGQEHPFFFVEVGNRKIKLGGPEAQRQSKENWYHPGWVSLDRINKINLVPEGAKEKLLKLLNIT